MTVQPTETIEDSFYSREEYRSWAEAQPRGRFERIDGRIVRMAAERVGHALVKAAVHAAMFRAVREGGLRCQVFPDGVTIEIGDSDYEPDASVNCGDSVPLDDVAIPNPVIVVEVLSPGTASVDMGKKLVDYFRLSSIAHYLLVHPGNRFVIHHSRDGERIATAILHSGEIAMEPPGIRITVEEIFDGL